MTTILPGIDLGKGEKGERRHAVLKQLAADGGHNWSSKSSVGRMICALADAQLFYAVMSDNTNDTDSIEKITFLSSPERKNMSREACVEGWLGTTDGIDKSALGLFDNVGARKLLLEHGVKIPPTVEVEQNTSYWVGGSERAERVNQQNVYNCYRGNWLNPPAWAVKHCYDPQRVMKYRVWDQSDGPECPLWTLSINDGISWYDAPGYDADKESAEQRGNALLGKLFDAGRMGF